MKTACVEKRANKALGGTCLNIGCIPSKALLDSSEMYDATMHKLVRHGIKVGSVALDLETMLKRKDKVVSELTGGVGFLFKKYGVTPVLGAARLLKGNKVEVTAADGAKSTLEAKNVLLATGSESTELPFMKYDGKYIVSSTEALNFNPVPKHLIVVGGGYIGLELGSVWKRLGSKVTVLEFLPRILSICDGEIAGEVHKLLTKQGFVIHVDTKVTGATVKGDSVTVTAQAKDGKELSFQGDRILVSVGRRPYTAGLGLDDVGVKYDAKSGRVDVDEHFQTNVPGVYAIGDLIAGPMLAHKASEEGVVCVEQLTGMKPHVNYNAIPSVIYNRPEVATVGSTEQQLKAKGVEYRVGKITFSRHRASEGDGRARRLRKGAGRRQDRPRSRRPHPRPAGVGFDRGVRDDHGV